MGPHTPATRSTEMAVGLVKLTNSPFPNGLSDRTAVRSTPVSLGKSPWASVVIASRPHHKAG